MGNHSDIGFEPTPAISRNFTDSDSDLTILSTPHDTVSFSRGMGDNGQRVQVVEGIDCPACNFGAMVRRWRVSSAAGTRDTVQYWCLNPNCAHFVRDHLSHDCHGNYPQRNVTEPVVTE